MSRHISKLDMVEKDGPRDTLEFPVRINKYLACMRICSRREADELIRLGKVNINGHLAGLGDRVGRDDKVEIAEGAGKPLVYLAFNKPRGIITHSPQKKEKSIEDILKFHPKVFPMGRLDKPSRGLIILSNDGRITDRLLHPDFAHEKEYVVTVDKDISSDFLHKMGSGVTLDDGYKTRKAVVRKVDSRTFAIILTEGKKRQIRRMCEILGYAVTDLKRTRVMNILLEDLKDGSYRRIEGMELETFLRSLGL